MTSNYQVRMSCRSYRLLFENPNLGKKVCERSQVRGTRHEKVDRQQKTYRDRPTVIAKELEGSIRRIYALFDKATLRAQRKSRLLVSLFVIAFVTWLSAILYISLEFA